MNRRNKYHIKRIATLRDDSVWLVDGKRIRKDLNENFVKFGHNDRFPFIPKDELWIDEETDFREHHFYLDHLFAERTLIDFGMIQDKADDIAAILEAHDREKAMPRKAVALKDDRDALVKKIRVREFSPFSREYLRVWLVDGKTVRDFLLTDFAEGGHDRVYPFVPCDEIWIEEILSEQERRFTLLHELHERHLMGKGKQYPQAHHGATIVEDRYRDHPEKLEDRIMEELEGNRSP